jgi:sterol desaturase/sphingolipid hydroxylase (fatty acid hydroxylase superfamily)
MDTLTRTIIIALPLVLIAATFEGIYLGFVSKRGYDWKSYGVSVADQVIRRAMMFFPYAIATPILAFVYDHRIASFQLDSLVSIAGFFLGMEFLYYWFHRASHRVSWFWASHAVHHSPNVLNLAVAFRLGWTGRVTGTIFFFSPLVLLGYEPEVVTLALTANLLYQFWLHADWIGKLGPIEYVFNTPSHHRVHHARNLEYLDKNYGGVLILFDRLFGTFAEERGEIPCDYGLTKRVEGNNLLKIEFVGWMNLWKNLATARTPREFVYYFIRPPDWTPKDGTENQSGLQQTARGG